MAPEEGASTGFGIGELARRTGVPVPTLRTWERRYGVPSPRRLSGGHRRYAMTDVTLVEEVLRLRERGLGLPTAMSLATTAAMTSEPSLFAALPRRHSGLRPHLVSKRTLLALSRGIEDECMACARSPVLFAGFQHARFFRQSAARWAELTRTARSAVVFADFGRRQRSVKGSPLRVHLPSDAPLRREWLLVCDSADLSACLAAWELPDQDGVPDVERRFELMWSVDPSVVRDASQLCREMAMALEPRSVHVPELPVSASPAPSGDLLRAQRLFHRVLRYLDAAPPGSG